MQTKRTVRRTFRRAANACHSPGKSEIGKVFRCRDGSPCCSVAARDRGVFDKHPHWSAYFREPVTGEIDHLINLAGANRQTILEKVGPDPVVAVIKIDAASAARVLIKRSAMPFILADLQVGGRDVV